MRSRVNQPHLSFSPLSLSVHTHIARTQTHTQPESQSVYNRGAANNAITLLFVFFLFVYSRITRTKCYAVRSIQYTSATGDECPPSFVVYSLHHTHTHTCPHLIAHLVVLHIAIHFAERMTFYHSAQVQHTTISIYILCWFHLIDSSVSKRKVAFASKAKCKLRRKLGEFRKWTAKM